MYIKKYFLAIVLLFLMCSRGIVLYGASLDILYESEEYPPFKYSLDGNLQGFEVELNKHIFNSGEYNIIFSQNNWEDIFNKLKSGKIDTSGLTAIVEDRSNHILFSKPVLSSYISIYSRKEFPKINLKDLKRYRVGVGSSQYTEDILYKKVGLNSYSTFSTIEESIDALKDGSIDILFENQEVVNYYLIKKNLKGDIIPQITNVFPIKVAYGVKKDNHMLVEFINKKLDDIYKSGVYEEIYQKYFYEHSDIYKDSHNNKMMMVIVGVLIIFVLLQVYIKYLRKKVFKAFRELRKQHDWLRITLASIGDAVITTDEKSIITFSNFEAQKLFRLASRELEGKRINDLLKGIKDERGNDYIIPIKEVINQGVVITLEDDGIFVLEDESLCFVNGTVAPIRNDSSEIIGSVIALRDITEQKKSKEIIHNMAYYDSLTGLPNRTLFSDRLSMAIAQAKRNDQLCALIILDLDNFKAINDTMGHTVGDLLLKKVSEKIKKCVREVDTVARLGGDEFIILQPQINDVSDVTRAAERILSQFHSPWELENGEYFITASLGIVVYPNDGQSEQILFKNADTAMYRAKETGKNNYQLFTETMNIKVQQKLEIENSLRRAAERGELQLFYQPQVDIESGRITGVEALLRWYRPGLGLVPPMDFIPVAEESGLIVGIGEWVLREACRQNKEWLDSGIEPMLMAVNLSARQFQQMNLYSLIEDILEETGMPPTLLELEITESTVISNLDFAIEVLSKLREKGIRISLDDFGTGYSSLNYLKKFPIDTLKIDKSFVHDISSNSNEEAIAKSVIELAHKMHLSVVAEGVEIENQLTFLREQRCDKFQGYLYSRPLPANEIEKMLRNNGLSSII